MAFSSGTFTFTSNSFAPSPVFNTVISESAAASTWSELATALSTCLLKDGTQTLTANIPMGNFKLTGLSAGTAAGQSLRYEQGLQSILTTTGDTIATTAANTAARLAASASVAANATTSDVWTARETVLTGGAVTFTALTAAPYVGAVAWVYMNAAHVFTDGAVFDVQGGANYTAAIGDWVRINAVTVSTFDVTIFPANGGTVATGGRIPITLATPQASTSGTSIDFTGIPAGVKRITVNFVGVSTNGTSSLLVQLGDSGGFEVAGYLSMSTESGVGNQGYTTGFGVRSVLAANVDSGSMTLNLENSSAFTWTSNHIICDTTASVQFFGAGSKSLSAELTQVRITTVNGTDAFDAGQINISYE